MRLYRRVLMAALVALAMQAGAMAEGTRSIGSVPTRVAGACDTSIGVGASAEAVDFDDLGDSLGWHDKTFSQAVMVRNRGSVDIMVQVVPWDGSDSGGGSVSASQLTTPTENGSETVVRVVPAGQVWTWTDLQIIGIKWQGVTSAGSACVEWIY